MASIRNFVVVELFLREFLPILLFALEFWQSDIPEKDIDKVFSQFGNS